MHVSSSSALFEVALASAYKISTGPLPDRLLLDEGAFADLWALHPNEYHQIRMYGRLVATPRWQQAYGHDYRYTGNLNKALPVPTAIKPLLDWARKTVEPRLNGILINWYDGSKGHYIGPHTDSPEGLIEAAPIVTISDQLWNNEMQSEAYESTAEYQHEAIEAIEAYFVENDAAFEPFDPQATW
jgi:hypothetical protein